MATALYMPASRDVVRYSLDLTRYRELSHFFDTNATIKHCVGLLDRFLFHDIELKGAKPHMNEYLVEYFLPFFRNMLRNVLILGWCPYQLKKVKDPITEENILVPEIVPVSFMSCELHVNMKTIEYEFKFYELDGNAERKNTHVFMYSDPELIANPSLIHSVLNGTLEDYRIVQQIKRFTIQSEFNRSNPTVYLMRAKGTHGVSNTFGATTGPRGGNDATRDVRSSQSSVGVADFYIQEASQSSKLADASVSMASNIEFHQNEMRDRAINHQRNYYNMGLDFAPQWHNNLFIVPPDMQLAANPSMPESRVDQLTMERNLSSTIYLSFGIPESMMGFLGGSQQSTRGSTSKSSKLRSDVNIMDLNSFESTIGRYRNFCDECFIVLYASIFHKKIARDVIDFKPPELYTLYIQNVLKEQGLLNNASETNKDADEDESDDSDEDKDTKITKRKAPAEDDAMGIKKQRDI